MPKLDPTDPSTSTAAAPLPSTTATTPQPPTLGITSTSTAPGAGANGFGSTPASGFGAPATGSAFGSSTPASSSSGFGGASSSGFGSSSSGFGSSSSAGGFGGSSSFGGSSGGFGGSSMGGGFGGGMGGAPMTAGLTSTGQSTQAQNLQSTGGAMQEGGVAAIETDKGFGDFINSKWRPLMAVIYMITCMTDFVVFPILWSMMQAYFHGQVTSQWQPLTLQGAGLYHIAMGAVLGLAAYGRSQEKIAGKA